MVSYLYVKRSFEVLTTDGMWGCRCCCCRFLYFCVLFWDVSFVLGCEETVLAMLWYVFYIRMGSYVDDGHCGVNGTNGTADTLRAGNENGELLVCEEEF